MLKRTSLLLLILLLTYASVSMAQGPTRKQVIVTKEIAAPPEKVWAMVGDFQDMGWHPAVAKTEGDGGSDPGATRRLTLNGGDVVQEKLEKYDADSRSFFYRITDVDVAVFPVSNYSSWVSVEPADNGSVVTWKGAFYRGYPNNDPPPEVNDQAAVDAVTGLYEAGLDNVKQRAEAGE
ncbi:MAG: SRPBCC family protein [Thiohalocapsa sp.]